MCERIGKMTQIHFDVCMENFEKKNYVNFFSVHVRKINQLRFDKIT